MISPQLFFVCFWALQILRLSEEMAARPRRFFRRKNQIIKSDIRMIYCC